MTEPAPRKSDLGVRVMSAVVMVAVAGTALWLGGTVWMALSLAVTLALLWEWYGLIKAIAKSRLANAAWCIGGLFYIGFAALTLNNVRTRWFGDEGGFAAALLILVTIIATDIGAYAAGRTVGGPKIAASISPNKTWAGLGGGIIAAVAAFVIVGEWPAGNQGGGLIFPALAFWPVPVAMAILAQVGDFFESWMKRRAGLKDSGTLIPGHGGFLDRLDGLLSVLFVIGLVGLAL